MNNTYLEKRRLAIRKKQSNEPKTVVGKSLSIEDNAVSAMDKLVIRGVNRQISSANPISREYPRDILSSDSFNLTLCNMKNEITDEYIARLSSEDWTNYKDINENGVSTYYISPRLQLKPNTTYTFYRSSKENRSGSQIALTQPYSLVAYCGLGYKQETLSTSNYGITTWIEHHTQAGLNHNYFTFTTDDVGEVWFSSVGTTASNFANWFNSIHWNGMVITEGSYTQEQMESAIINIPESITLDDGTEVKLQLWNVFNSSNENCFYDNIEVDYENQKVTYTKKIYECVMNGQKSEHNKYGYMHTTSPTNTVYYRFLIYQNYIWYDSNKPNDSRRVPQALDNLKDISYTPICNEFTGKTGYNLYYSSANIYSLQQIYVGIPGDYTGFMSFFIPVSYIDVYDGWWTCHLEELSVDTGAVAYFTLTIDDVATTYSFTAPIDMGEFTSVKFNPETVQLLINEEEVAVEVIDAIPEGGIELTFESLDDDVTYYGETKAKWRKNWQYFKDLNAIGKPVIFRYPAAEQYWVTTDITNSDLGRELLNLKLSRYNTISTDNWYCNELEITYKAR